MLKHIAIGVALICGLAATAAARDIVIIAEYPALDQAVAKALGGKNKVVTVAPGVGTWQKVSADATFVLADLPPAGEIKRLAERVKKGARLVLLAGALSHPNAAQLGKLLPLTPTPAKDAAANATVLVLDRSGSMAGKKIEWARAAVHGVIRSRRPHDLVGMVAFDEKPLWIAPLQPASKRRQLREAIGRYTGPQGGTSLFPALDTAVQQLYYLEANRKEILLLSDGVSKDAAVFPLLEKARARGIRLSVLAIGPDADRKLLSSVADEGKGRYRFVGAERFQSPDTLAGLVNHSDPLTFGGKPLASLGRLDVRPARRAKVLQRTGKAAWVARRKAGRGLVIACAAHVVDGEGSPAFWRWLVLEAR